MKKEIERVDMITVVDNTTCEFKKVKFKRPITHEEAEQWATTHNMIILIYHHFESIVD